MAAVELSFFVPLDVEPQRVDRFLVQFAAVDDAAYALHAWSRSRIQKLFDADAVHINGRPARRSTSVRCGDLIAVCVPDAVPSTVEPEAIPLDVLYEDEDQIVVNKAPGMVVHPGAGHSTGTLVNALLHHCRDLSGIGGVERPGIVHRLDAGTSGALIVAKNDAAHKSLAQQFAERRVKKVYRAFVLGTPPAGEQTIRTLYGRHKTHRKRFTGKTSQGRNAVTHYQRVSSSDGISELRVRLETGRTHQIRVHLSEAGFPIVGDPVYGPRHPERHLQGAALQSVQALTRQALHAAHLAWTHPRSGDAMTVDAPLAKDLEVLVNFQET